MAKQFRIVGNGINYRVQWFGKTWFLRRPKWYWLKEYTWAGDYICDFSTSQEAQNAIDEANKQFAAKEQGYVPIMNDSN